MLLRVFGLLACGILMGTLAQSGVARAQSEPAKAKTVHVTGCLAQGSGADQFTITENGKTYQLTSSSVTLKDHLGHKVTVTGKVTESKGTEAKAGSTEEKMDVSNLKMVSTTCP